MQYAPPYYYAGGNQPAPNGQQPQQPQQHQQHQPQQPQIHMPDHQLYAQHPHGMPTYQIPMPHQHHPGMMHPGGDFNMLTKPKRKQVKNACVNCQKACKKCDDGRPCQRCIKYGLVDTCTNSVRKERKKGIKRGPYKRRNQANGESASPSSSTYPAGTTAASNVPTSSYPAYANYDAYQAATSTAPGVAYSNPMQQYVMAMQQQQAMYQNMPYQPSMAAAAAAAAAASSSPSLAHPSASTPLSHSSPTTATPTETKEQPATNEATPTTGDNKPTGEEDDGSKLNILSQLCSDVLDRSPKEEHATMTPPPTTSTTNDQPSPAAGETQSQQPQPQQQSTPILSTPISSSPSSANASPTLYKQDAPQAMYPQQQQQQQQQQW
ncbi:hypothetical protein BC941DRAFT_512299 [Chlamydoabsidia padenii]|nr:hypothetical protein BC941DRAFT_512299 [Chlamydoabsidia padenii]